MKKNVKSLMDEIQKSKFHVWVNPDGCLCRPGYTFVHGVMTDNVPAAVSRLFEKSKETIGNIDAYIVTFGDNATAQETAASVSAGIALRFMFPTQMVTEATDLYFGTEIEANDKNRNLVYEAALQITAQSLALQYSPATVYIGGGINIEGYATVNKELVVVFPEAMAAEAVLAADVLSKSSNNAPWQTIHNLCKYQSPLISDVVADAIPVLLKKPKDANRKHAVAATRQTERDTLAAIMDLVADLGPNSYIGAAFDGVFEVAEENIENDACFSMKARANALEAEAERRLAMAKEKSIEAQRQLQAAQEFKKKFEINRDEWATLRRMLYDAGYQIEDRLGY